MRRVFVSVFFFLEYLIPAFAQRYNFINYFVIDGLVHSQVNQIAQDERGNLLFATGGGISFYNGQTFKNYTKSSGLPQNYVSAVAPDKNGNVILGTEGGLAVFNGKKFSAVTAKEGLSSHIIQCLLPLDKGKILAGTSKGLCVVKSNAGKYNAEQLAIDGRKTINVSCLFKDKDENIWVGTVRDGLYFFFAGKSSVLPGPALAKIASHPVSILSEERAYTVYRFDDKNILCGNNIRYIYQDNSGAIWISCWRSGITKVSSKKIFNYSSKGKNLPLSCDRVCAVQEDKNGLIWFGTDGFGAEKIHKDAAFERKNVQTFTVANGLPSNHIFSIYLDREENLWFGTYNGGVSKLCDARFVHYLSGVRGVEKNVLSVFQDKEGNDWFGTFGGGAYVFDGKHLGETGEMKNYSWEQGISESGVSAINQTNEGILLFGTIGGGISMLSPGQMKKQGKVFAVLNNKNGFPFNFITVLFKDSKGNIWVGSEENGAGRISFSGKYPRQLIQVSEKNGLSSNAVSSIFEDKNGNILVGTQKGVNVIKNNNNLERGQPEIKIYNEENGLPSNHIRCICADKLDRIWLGTNGDGIIICSNDKNCKKFISVTEGLTSRQIASFVQDENGTMWVGTNQGINKISMDDRGNITRVKNYTKAEGFTALECYGNAAMRDKSNNLWYGTTNGAAKYLRQADSPNKFEPITQISGIRLNFKNTDWEKYAGAAKFDSLTPWFDLPENLVLPYYENRIAFDFVAASARSPEKIQYQFYLKGLDNGWNPATHETHASYSSLSPGEYTFFLTASNCDHVWNKASVKFHFVITPPFWKTKWFFTCCFIIAAMGIILIIRIREQLLHLQKKRLEQQVKMRTAEVVQQKEIIENKNKHILQNISYAKRIQDAILPAAQLQNSFSEIFILHLPKEIVSGDFYWYAEVEKNKTLLKIIALADCTGHGVPGAFMSMIGNDSLNYVIIEKGLTNPSEILTSLNDRICRALNHSSEHGACDGMDIALCVIDEKNKTIEYAAAHRPLYFINGVPGEIKEIKASPVTIGRTLSKNNLPFQNHKINYSDGNKIYLFTDGYTDQFGGEADEKFMSVNFKKFIIEISAKTLKEQCMELQKKFEEWKQNRDILDDVLVIGLKL